MPPSAAAIGVRGADRLAGGPGAPDMSREYALPMIEPMTATPSAPPTWRVTSLMAEPTPALPRARRS